MENQNTGEKKISDVAIIGSGPAGLSAALNLKLHNKSVVWFGAGTLSDKVEKSECIANYPGYGKISGHELNEKFKAQIAEEGLEIIDKKVTNISKTRSKFMVLADNDIYEVKSVLLATGAVSAKGFEQEEEYLGRGVSYCATCDGFLYPEKTIAVFCGTKKYEHEVEYLAGIAAKVYLFTPYKDSDIKLPNVEVLPAPIKAVKGGMKINAVVLTDGTEVPVDGFFVLRTSVAPATLVSGLAMDGPHIQADRQCKTNKEGIFAAGDCTGRPYQITKAVGEGNIAAHSVIEYLAETDKM